MKRWMNNLFMKDFRRVVEAYELIQEGDRILVGVSGGKDSSLLFYALSEYQKISEVHYDVQGIAVDHGLLGNIEAYTEFCAQNSLPLQIHEERYAMQFAERQTGSVCYTCARIRKGILKRYALENGFNKIAFGHTKDDCVETFMMNIIKHGRLSAMAPKTESEEGIEIIRPLIGLSESNIIKAVAILGFPLMKDLCKHAEGRLRSNAERLISEIELTVPDFSDKVIQALSNVDYKRLL